MRWFNKCVVCLEGFQASYRSNVCPGCESPKTPGFPVLSSTRILGKGTHWENRMTEEEVNEIKRNVSVPVPGGWKGGRRGDNGKIQEKPIKY